MRARQADRFLRRILALTELDADLAAANDGQLELADLIAFGKVWVEIVFAGKYRFGRDVAPDGQAKANGAFHRPAVEHRQHARQGDIDGVGLHVRLGAEGGRTAGKNL